METKTILLSNLLEFFYKHGDAEIRLSGMPVTDVSFNPEEVVDGVTMPAYVDLVG